MSGRAGRPPRSAAERWVAGASAAIVAAMAAVLLIAWATGPGGPPALTAGRSGAIERQDGAYRVPFEVRNDGGETAADVQVVAELVVGGTVAGEGEQSFPFLSGGETESGAFLFATDPARGVLTIAVASYAAP